MRINDLLHFSISNLFKRKFRTFLTVLGVVIGTISIVVMISLGMGMKASIMESMNTFGSVKMIQVNYNQYENNNAQDGDKKFLDDNLVNEILSLNHVEAVVPCLSTMAIMTSGKYAAYVDLMGISKDGYSKMDIKLKQGDYPKDDNKLELVFGNMILARFFDKKSNVYIYYDKGEVPDIDLLNDKLYIYLDQDKYFSQGNKDENGNSIPAPKKYSAKGSGLIEGEFEEWNSDSYSIYCDMEVLKSLLKKEYKGKLIPGQPTKKSGKPYKDIFYSELKVYVDDISNVSEIQTYINNLGYETYADAEWIASEMNTMNIIQLVLGGIGGVSLFVAAIGITNTMSMSIYERTKEIGIMKVIGCKIKDIQTMFLIEAGFIGFIGGVVGVGISYILSFSMNKFLVGVMEEMGYSKLSIIPWWLSIAAIIFAIIIGMIAGFFPSLRAMKLSPLTAIKNE